MAAFSLRPFDEADYPRVAEIFRLVEPDAPLDAAMVRRQDELFASSGYALHRVVALAEDGLILGTGHASHVPLAFAPDRYQLAVLVDPAYRRRGVGGALYDALLAWLRERGACALRAGAREGWDEGIAFLERRGFVEAQRVWPARLDLAGFDSTRFAGVEERVRQRGIDLTTYAAETARDPGAARRLHALYEVCRRDEPRLDPPTAVPFGQFVAAELEAPNALLDACFIARDGDQYVGMCQLVSTTAGPDLLANRFTAVAPAYRRRGIALALKLRSIQHAREMGARTIQTHNNTRNAPMLRLNEALGFTRRPAWITFVNELLT